MLSAVAKARFPLFENLSRKALTFFFGTSDRAEAF